MAKKCIICGNPFKLGQSLSVVCEDLRSINTNGDFDILDFLQECVVVHQACFFTPRHIPTTSDISMNSMITEAQVNLKELGDVVSKSDIKTFFIETDCKDVSDFISKWFEKRNKF